MHVALFFPPHWTPTMPHLALPSLTAYLRAEGISVSQRDLNVEAFDRLLSRDHLQRSLEAAHDRLALSQWVRSSDSRARAQAEQLERALVGADELVEDIELAKRTLRSPSFYKADENLGAMLTVIDALELVSAPFYPTRLSWDGYQTPHSPDSIQAILAATTDREHNLFIDLFERMVVPQVCREAPDMVGISVTSAHQIIPAFTLAALIKASLPGAHVVMGGKMITCWRDDLPNSPALFDLIDSAVYWEGERALSELVNCLAGDGSLEKVPNLIYPHNGEIRVNPVGEPTETTQLPTPDFEGLSLESYFVPELVLPIEACRGCYWRRCAFCNLGYGQSREFRARQPAQLAGQMADLQSRHQANHFFFVDEALSPHMLGALAEEIEANDLELSWAACARFERGMERDLLARASGAGLKMLMYGLESGTQEVLDRLHKGTDLATISSVLRGGAEAGIWNHVFTFFGFPGETSEEAEATVSFVLDHLDAIHSIASGTFVMEKHADVFENHRDYGVSRITSDPEADLAFQYGYEVETGLSAGEAQVKLAGFVETLDALRQPQIFLYDVYNLLYAARFPDRSALWRSPADAQDS